MEIRQLELFPAGMASRRLARASEKVYLSAGAASMQLYQLAAELRTELFVRSDRQVLPTPATLRLAEHARTVMQQIRHIEQEFEADPSKDSRPFHFATGATALIYCLAKPLRAVRARFPKAQIQVTVSVTETIVAKLLERQFDLGLISLPYPDAGLKVVPLFEEEFLVLAPSRTRVRGGSIGTIRASELKGVPFVLYPKASNMRTIIDAFFKDCGLAPTVIMEAADTEAIKGLVESGFGYSILPQLALRSHSRHFRVFRIADRRLARSHALAMPQTEYPRALTMAILPVLQSALAKR